ncbi:alpha/beta hydrolase [Haloechinothrix salitolerans]|uniref:Alpha/beta hydrolase n=1 Tax=Haloechinothrix salitolerans TaxID=926830 RepID=A0ABW2C3L5_9PSEU
MSDEAVEIEHDASLTVLRARTTVRAVALVLHGGAEHGHERIRPWSHAYLRMVPFARALHRAGRTHGLEVRLVRNRVRGWNKPHLHPVHDARDALAEIRRDHPDVPVVLIGHSMGGRVALRVADDPNVVAVCALAPWTTEKDWVEPVADVRVLIAHGTQDAITSPEASHEYARRADHVTDVVRAEVRREGHALLRRPGIWTRLILEFTLDAAGIETRNRQREPLLTRAWDLPAPDRLRFRV